MKIIGNNFKYSGKLSQRSDTQFIILHHRAGEGDADSIHRSHLERGWAGIGYHFYVRKSGEIFKGRPIGAVGAHTAGKNSVSIEVCFEGNYETTMQMPTLQLKSGRELINYLKTLYPKAELKVHNDFQPTACPGRYFPTKTLQEEVREVTTEEAVQILQTKSGLEDETIDFLLCYKYGEELVKKLADAMI